MVLEDGSNLIPSELGLSVPWVVLEDEPGLVPSELDFRLVGWT